VFVEDTVAHGGADGARAVFPEHFRGGDQCSGGFGDVVNEEDVAAVDFADHVGGFHFRRGAAFFGDEAEAGAEDVGVGGGHFEAADVGGADDEVFFLEFVEVVEEDGGGVEVVDGDVEEALDLLAVQIHGEDAVCAGGDEEVGDEFGGDGDAGLVFAVLAGVAVEGDDGGDARGGGAARGVDHDEEFHQVMVRGGAGGLHEVDVLAAHVFVDFHEGLAVGEGCHGGVAEGDADAFADFLGKGFVGIAGEDF